MRILINDFAGHPFQIQLSRALARRGHAVLHCYCASNLSPKGGVERRVDDPAGFSIRKIEIAAPFEKYSLFKRWRQERAIGREVVNAAGAFRPDAIICANTPLGTQGVIMRYAGRANIHFTYWVQDILSIGIEAHLRRRLATAGAVLGKLFRLYESFQLIRSDQVVAISADFLAHFPRWLLRSEKIAVIENWAPLDELPMRPRANEWSRAQGLEGKLTYLYAGTLGLKHNPDLLLELAVKFRDRDDIRVVVISEGMGADYLAARRQELQLSNLLLLPFQPFDAMPEVLASADILVSILEKEAGVFAVPSKVLTYLCAARPLLLAVPGQNLAARIVQENGAGLTAAPDDMAGFLTLAARLAAEPILRGHMAARGRAYAERTFDIQSIVRHFEFLLQPPVVATAAALRPELAATPAWTTTLALKSIK